MYFKKYEKIKIINILKLREYILFIPLPQTLNKSILIDLNVRCMSL